MLEPDSLAGAGTERYGVTALLGRGGMGAVYRAVDRQSGEPVALKRLLLGANAKKQAQFTELFHQEFRTLAQLAHPQVVRAHDYGIDARGPYYTMELLEGQTLHDLAPLPWVQACALVRDVCSAVALLHSRRLLHRDLSPKNVQRMHDGRAKLIDFGAMTPTGQVAPVVGTPPLVPPEALLQQPLDARSDLYALGATLFYALTGVHAYPARSFVQLRELWRSPLPPPSARNKEVPPELDALVLSLLSHDPSARPSSAAEVIDRLSAIGALPRDEQLAVSHAYLLTPELVGRSAPLARVRTRIQELTAGRGGALVLEGAPGMGRSRMLDTVVLEAKLLGLCVARASAADSASGPYGVIGVLLRQLLEILPPPARASFTGLPAFALLLSGEISVETDARSRSELHGVLIVFLRAVARSVPLLLAVDDVDRCDEASQAALVSAMQACRRERALTAVTCGSDDGERYQTGALGLLREGGMCIALTAFGIEDSEALLSSVFGDVPHVRGLAARIHARAEGSPRGCMELAEHLRERGLVRYRAGSWELPAAIHEDDLPSSLSLARRMRLQALGTDARDLAEALALAEGSGLDFDAYLELTAHGDLERVRVALDELLLVQVLRCEGVHYSFEAQAWAVELRDGVSPERERMLCARVAEALSRRSADRLYVARYLWRAADKTRTIDVLLAELAQGSRWDRCPRDYAEILQGAAEACLTLSRSRRERFMLLHELMRLGSDLALPGMRAHLAELFDQLRRDSGLSDWEALDAGLPALPRLQRAFELAQQRHDAAPLRERGLPPLEAINALVRLVVDCVAVGAQTGDHAILALLPPLKAFYPVSPAIERLEQFSLPACECVIAGRYEQAKKLYLTSLSYLQAHADVPGIDEAMRQWSVNAVQYAIGCIDGGLGNDDALRYAALLERSPRWLVPAFSVRRIYHLSLGNHRQAERCRKQIELLLLQSPIKPPLAAGAVHQHLFSFSMADDLVGMRRAIPEMEALSRAHPTLAPCVAFARAELARICGDFDQALASLNEIELSPGEHPMWGWVAGARVHALLGLGRAQEAHTLGLGEHAAAEALGLVAIKDHIGLPLALAEAKLGDLAAATARLDAIIENRLSWSAQGVLLGWVYEARARVACWMGDIAAFERNAQLCAQQFKKSEGDPALSAKYERLMLEARTLGLSLRAELTEALATHTTVAQTSFTTLAPEAAAALYALSACDSPEERAKRTLMLLMNSAGAEEGELYLVGEHGLALTSASCAGLSDDDTRSLLTQLVERAQDDDDTAEYTATLSFHAPALPDQHPRLVWPVVLTSSRGGATAVVGIAALHFAPDQPVRVPFEIATAAADALIHAGDVTTSSFARTDRLRR